MTDKTATDEMPTAREGRHAIERDIAETREQLGHTVEALAAKADVKNRSKEKIGEAKEKASAKPGKTAAMVAGLLTVVFTVILWRRHSH